MPQTQHQAQRGKTVGAPSGPTYYMPGTSAQAAARWPKETRWERAIDAGWHPRSATKKLKSRLRAITHGATLAKERAEAKKRGELALADAVEELEPEYVEYRIQEFSHIEEDDGNEEANGLVAV